eukprot:6212411-Pleurochrysis_carterae.AAC.4
MTPSHSTHVGMPPPLGVQLAAFACAWCLTRAYLQLKHELQAEEGVVLGAAHLRRTHTSRAQCGIQATVHAVSRCQCITFRRRACRAGRSKDQAERRAIDEAWPSVCAPHQIEDARRLVKHGGHRADVDLGLARVELRACELLEAVRALRAQQLARREERVAHEAASDNLRAKRAKMCIYSGNGGLVCMTTKALGQGDIGMSTLK